MKTKLLISVTLLMIASVLLSACGPKAIFKDDFSDVNSGWDRSVMESGSTDYSNGVYRMNVTGANKTIWANPYKNFTDVSVEVDATLVSGTVNNDFGLICRYKDMDNYIKAEISSDGYYGIVKKVNGEKTNLTGSYVRTELVKQGNTTNHIKLDCVGSTITFYINGTQANSFTVTELTSGDVGLIAGTYDEPDTEITFDNFVVYQP